MFGSGSGMSVSGAKAATGVVGDGSEAPDGKPGAFVVCSGGMGNCVEEDAVDG